jgi:aminopeptidase N
VAFLSRRLTAGLGATVLATALALPFSHGSAGIGDSLYPDYGNGGYDVGHYDIHVTYHPSTKQLVGTTTITATATQHLTQFDLDFVLTARHVTVNGQAAHFSQHLVTKPADNFGGELVVTPKSGLHKGSAMKIVVTYDGTPAHRLVHGFTPWVTTTTGALAIGEPEAAAWWFPSNDHPRDKATYDITMHMPKGLQGISNGVLISHTTKGTGTSWHWRESQPMATYLAFAAMGSYTLTTTHSYGVPVYTAIAKKVGSFGKAATKDVKRTAEVIAFESTLFGPYPFTAMGAVVPDGTFDYALENQTKPVYDRVFWDEGTAMYVVAHENAHEWFGDSVSVNQWKDIWLNEGFATYAEWLWSEHAGEGSAQSLFDSFYDLFPASSDFWKTAIDDPTIPETFEDPVYDRGGMTLGALRVRIGDADFFSLLQQWAVLHKNGTATTPEFIALAEQVSGQDLASFFSAWLSSRTKPAATAANGFPPAAIAASRAGVAPAPASLPALLRTQALLTRTRP